MNSLVLVMMVTWVWFVTLVFSSVAAESVPLQFNLAEADKYSSFIEELRNRAKDSTTVCEFKVTKKTPVSDPEFILVNLIAESSKTVTLAIDVGSLYVLGYLDKYNGKTRAITLKDTPVKTQEKLNKDAAVKILLNFGGNYIDLEREAKQTRSETQLGVSNLGFAIESVYDKKINGKDVARFLLIAIQMVSEATRFKYIENKVAAVGQYGSVKPDSKVLSLENNWQKVSEAIRKSASSDKPADRCVKISPAIELKNEKDGPWKIEKVKDIEPDLGILKFK